MRVIRLILIALLLITPLGLQAQKAKIENPSPIDRQYMQEQRDSINNLTRRHFGHQLNGKRNNDFRLMQRLLDEQIVKSSQIERLQAMGVILGDILKTEQGLTWTIYIDKYGRSRALAVPGKRDVVFPITMISRRAETGAKVDIETVYHKAVEAVKQIKRQIIVY